MVKVIPYRFQPIHPDEVEGLFQKGEEVESLATLLLENDATAIYPLDASRSKNLYGHGDECVILLSGANYHGGHSEGWHKIIVQEVLARKGPYVLFQPPGSNQKTFHLESVTWRTLEPEFSEEVANIGKMDKHFLFQGDPLQVFEHFRSLGFTFSDDRMPEDQYDHLADLSYQARKKR